MKLRIKTADVLPPDANTIFLCSSSVSIEPITLTKTEKAYVHKELSDNKKIISVNSYFKWNFIVVGDAQINSQTQEDIRERGARIASKLNDHQIESVYVVNLNLEPCSVFAFTEGLALANYQFTKYLSKKSDNTLKEIFILNQNIQKKLISRLQAIVEAVYIARDLINEPVSELNAVQLAKEVERLAYQYGFTTNILDKQQIEKNNMGGLLAVNKGSVDPPTFSILEWKPRRHINDNPIVLIGKGITYDTGGLSLKPTADSMDTMKSDMSGAAAVIGTFVALAKNKVPYHVIGLIPATDNRPGGNAYAPGDIIKMMDGTTVEMLNADAEGRMILADALSYAKQFDPQLVVDLATLTGSAASTLGRFGIATMTNKHDYYPIIETAGFDVFERTVQFPMWDDYTKLLESKIADLKNIGGKYAGAITAAKFLEHFTDYPWIHLDIAGPAFLNSSDGYRSAGGTGVGVRLLLRFIDKLIEK